MAKKKYICDVSLHDLLEAGCHFGHQARRWHPKMRPYLYAKKEGIHIFDLVKTKAGLEQACEYMYDQAKQGKLILMVGTKRQAKEVVKQAALRCGTLYVTERWLGGTLTNFQQISSNISRLQKLKDLIGTREYKQYTKKEQLLIRREIKRIERFISGLTSMDRLPDVLFVVDTKREQVAVQEANKLGIPVVGIVDSNANPELVDIVIPANDDAIKSVQLIVNKIAEAILAGKQLAQKSADKAEKAKDKKDKSGKK